MQTLKSSLLAGTYGALLMLYVIVLATFPTSPFAYLASSAWMAAGTFLAVYAESKVGTRTWRRSLAGLVIFTGVLLLAVEGKWALAVYGFDSERHGAWPHRAVLELLSILDIALGTIMFAGSKHLLEVLRDHDLRYPFVPPSERPRPPG